MYLKNMQKIFIYILHLTIKTCKFSTAKPYSTYYLAIFEFTTLKFPLLPSIRLSFYHITLWNRSRPLNNIYISAWLGLPE